MESFASLLATNFLYEDGEYRFFVVVGAFVYSTFSIMRLLEISKLKSKYATRDDKNRSLYFLTVAELLVILSGILIVGGAFGLGSEVFNFGLFTWVLSLFVVGVSYLEKYYWLADLRTSKTEPSEPVEIVPEARNVPDAIKPQLDDIGLFMSDWESVEKICRYLPHFDLITEGKSNRLGEVIKPAGKFATPELEYLSGTFFSDHFLRVSKVKFDIAIPKKLRTSHHHIVAGSGHGKTQCIQQMLVEDFKTDASIVLIDSQGDMIKTIAPRVDPDRLILVDPEHCPPSLALFSDQKTEREEATTIELYEYIFSALDAQMTSKQQTAYRFVIRLLLKIPYANITTMREIFEPGVAHQEHITKLDEVAQSFFETQFNSKQFADTREQIVRRLYTVLESRTLNKMLSATKSNLNVAEAVNNGKILLVSTNKDFLKQGGSTLFGRIFVAQVMQAVMARPKNNRPLTYLYLDEFQDYAEDSHVMLNMFEQVRKYNLGMIVAHQYLGQLPERLAKSIASNTAIKFAGGVSSEDARKLSAQFRIDKQYIEQRRVGNFACYFKNERQPYNYHVEFGQMEKLPIREYIESIYQRMNHLYGLNVGMQGTAEVVDFKPAEEVEELLEAAEPKAPKDPEDFVEPA